MWRIKREVIGGGLLYLALAIAADAAMLDMRWGWKPLVVVDGCMFLFFIGIVVLFGGTE